MKTNNQHETEAILRVFEQLKSLEQQLQAAQARIRELEALVYGGSTK
jgi:hypothetical protein